MFSEKAKANANARKNYDVAYENLAIPEVRPEPKPEDAKKDPSEKEETESIVYDTVAIPEIHIRKK